MSHHTVSKAKIKDIPETGESKHVLGREKTNASCFDNPFQNQ